MKKSKLSAIFLVFAISNPVLAMELQEFHKKVIENHGMYKSINSSKESIVLKRIQGDVGLSPVFTFKASSLDDQKPATSIFSGTRTKAQEYSLGLAKKFSSGTALNLSVITQDAHVTGLTAIPPITTATESKVGKGAVALGFSQSLWKDSFGSGTRLRQERESYQEKTELIGVDLQLNQLLIEAEESFWDLIYLQKEQKLRVESLERAKKLETWMMKRVRDGIGEKSDLVQIQALVATREMQLVMTNDSLMAARKRVADMLETQVEELPTFEGDLNSTRNLASVVKSKPSKNNQDNKNSKIYRLDSVLSVYKAKTKQSATLEVQDALRPELTLEGQYSTNSLSDSMSGATSEISKTDKPTTAIALKFTYLFDTDAKTATVDSIKSEAKSAMLESERKLLESDSAWIEINRRHKELSTTIEKAERIAQLQSERAKLEGEKLSKGRTITMSVIQAEQDAADSELNLSKLKAEQRKLEAKSKMFVEAEIL